MNHHLFDEPNPGLQKGLPDLLRVLDGGDFLHPPFIRGVLAHSGWQGFPVFSPQFPRTFLRVDPAPKKRASGPTTESKQRPAPFSSEAVVCRQCLHEITASTERTLVNGAHAHTFANPEGIVFEIVCYKNAHGCAYAGPASAEFTWFSGYVWRIAVCLNCHVHMGWRFSAPDGHYFHGLIVSRIIVRQA